jgi:hypothetical protein
VLRNNSRHRTMSTAAISTLPEWSAEWSAGTYPSLSPSVYGGGALPSRTSPRIGSFSFV